MADNSSKLTKALSSSNQGKKKSNFDIGKIDPRILKILGIENEFDIEDEQEYLSLLKEKMILISMGKSNLSGEDEELIIEEFKALKSKKFPKKKITAESFKRGTAAGASINLGEKLLLGDKIGITPNKLALPSSIDNQGTTSIIDEIKNALVSIIEQLTLFNKNIRDEKESDRKERETGRRRGREKELETGFGAVIKSAEKVIAPVKSLLQKIIDFILAVFIGRSLVLLLRWFKDPDNKKKVEAISRFLGDHWPKLLALFIAFGTGLGGFVRSLIGLVIKGTGALIKGAVALAARAKLKGAAGALKFLGGPKGKLIGKAVEVAAIAGGTVALSKGLGDFGGIGGEKESSGAEKESSQPVQKYSGGGKVSVPAFSGGGLNLSNMMKGASMGAMFGPLGMLLGGALGSGKPQQMASGFVSGEKGVDKVPAMLTDGEFVMSAGAVQKYGVDTLESMNAAGGGTNKPKVVSGTTYAFGGGFVGDNDLYRIAANVNRGENLPEISFDPKNPEHAKNFERIKQRAVSKGVYKPSPGVDVNPNYSRPSSPSSSQPPGGRTPPRSSSTSLMRRPTSALSTNVRPPMQSIRTNMNVPGGGLPRGSLSAVFAALEMKQRTDEGQTTAQAGLGAGASALGGQLGWMAGAKGGAAAGAAIGAMFGGVGAGPGAVIGAIAGGILGSTGGAMAGGKIADDISGVNATKERASRGGGGIVGGYGLKEQSFKDAPQTQVMTDNDGRPFVGHKALLNGKLHYKRGPEPGTGSTNPLEIIGRALFPGAYRANDARLANEKHKDALVNSLQSFRDRGMGEEGQARMMKSLGGNTKDTQKDLDARQAKLSTQNTSSKGQARLAKRQNALKSSGITPPSQPPVNVITKSNRKRGAHMGMNKGTSSGPTIPNFSSSSGSRSRRRTAATYGIG